MLCLQVCRAKPVRVSRYAYNAVLSCAPTAMPTICHTKSTLPYYAYRAILSLLHAIA